VNTGRQYARLRGEANVPLRRGAWYSVVRMTQTDAVLDVHQRMVNVPISLLQIAPRPTGAWSVVPRPPRCRAPTSWGARYAVCPQCATRAPLAKGASMRCAKCNGVFDVAWGDSYYS
jgi:hypothetical protein